MDYELIIWDYHGNVFKLQDIKQFEIIIQKKMMRVHVWFRGDKTSVHYQLVTKVDYVEVI